MGQLSRLFRKLTWQQRIWLAAAVIAVIGGITTLAHWNQERDFKPLFTGMAAEDAGPLLAKLRESATEYRLADNGSTVLVPSAQVAELRIQMAAAGLPKSGRIGFELFDKTKLAYDLQVAGLKTLEITRVRVRKIPVKKQFFSDLTREKKSGCGIHSTPRSLSESPSLPWVSMATARMSLLYRSNAQNVERIWTRKRRLT